MKRRDAIKRIGAVGTCGVVALAGCSETGSSGSEIEHTVNYASEQVEFVELSELSEEGFEANGSEAVRISGVATNTNSEEAYIELEFTVTDNEGVTVGTDTVTPKGIAEPVGSEEAVKFESAYPESIDSIREYTILVKATVM